MNRYIIITAAGPDRPGIVSRLTRILFESGCNIEDTSMTLLRGEFAMMLIVRLPQGTGSKGIRRRLNSAQKALGLSILLKPLSVKEARRAVPARKAGSRRPGRSYILSVYGSDQPGIVYRVTQLIASHAINITDMNTRVIGSRNKPIYVMILEVEIPKRVNLKTLKNELDKLKRRLNVDITLHSVEFAQL